MTIWGRRAAADTSAAETIDIEARLEAFFPEPGIFYFAPQAAAPALDAAELL